MDFTKVTLEALNTEHPERVIWGSAYNDYQLIYEGGLSFKRAAGLVTNTIASIQNGSSNLSFIDLMATRNRRRRFLYQLEGEPDTKYVSRWERCYYVNYAGVIIDYYRHWLFSQPPQIRPKLDTDESDLADAEAPEPPEWYEAFARDATGSGTSFLDLAKTVFGDVLVYRRAGWLIGLPDAVGETQDDASPVSLTVYDAREILDWQEDASGKLEWILLCKRSHRRDFPGERREVEVRTYIDRDSWAAWEVIAERDKDGNKVPPILLASGQHGLGEVPFEWMTIPEGLWVMNKLAAWAIDLFNQESMLSAGQLESCFLQPFVRTNEGTEDASNRVLGSGIIFTLRAADKDRGAEEFGWASPNIEPLKFSGERILQLRDEGYRIVHQMALAVDSQAIGAIARSGASKIEDRKATEIMLCAYGGYVRDFLLRTLDKISRLLGDGTEWVVDGYDNFEVSSMMEELQTAALVQTFDIPSPTFKGELAKQLATGRMLGHLDESLKAKIREEIDATVGLHAESMAEGPTQIDPKTGEPIKPQMQPAMPGGLSLVQMPPQTKESDALNLTSTDLGTIVTVNEARKSVGLDALPGGDGNLTIAEFKAKHSEVVAQAAAAEAGKEKPENPEDKAKAMAQKFGAKPGVPPQPPKTKPAGPSGPPVKG